MYSISIIIPHYNSPITLTRLLQSIGAYEDVEVIVVDDKSNKQIDLYEDCINQFQSENYKFLFNVTSENGAGVCRNVGVKASSGRWLLFADSDDLFLDGWYTKVKQYFECNADVVFFLPTSLDGEKVGERHLPYAKLVEDFMNQNEDSELHLRTRFFPPWSKMVRHQYVIDKQIVFEHTMYANDVMFSTKIGVFASKIEASNSVFYCLVEEPGSLTKNKSFESLYVRNEVICRVYHFLKEALPRGDFGKTYIRRTAAVNLVTAIRMKSDKADVKRLANLYKNNGIPIINTSLFNIKTIVRYLQKR